MARHALAGAWMDDAAALTTSVSDSADVARAARSAAALLTAAADVRALPDQGGSCRCGGVPCGFSVVAAPLRHDLCALAADLGAATAQTSAQAPPDLHAAAQRVLDALADIGPAVYWCRRLRHPVGGCWFGIGGDSAGCAALLRLSHRLDEAPRGVVVRLSR